MYIHKNGILLRKLGEADLDILFSLKQESWFGTHNIAVINEYDQRKWFEKISDSNCELYLIAYDNTNSHKVGICKITSIHWVNHSCEFGIDVFKNNRDRGYGKKLVEAGVDFAFEILNIHRLSTEILENNTRSFKSGIGLEGTVKEGVKRKAVYKCGVYLDSILLAILREDWESSNRVREYGGICNESYKPI